MLLLLLLGASHLDPRCEGGRGGRGTAQGDWPSQACQCRCRGGHAGRGALRKGRRHAGWRGRLRSGCLHRRPPAPELGEARGHGCCLARCLRWGGRWQLMGGELLLHSPCPGLGIPQLLSAHWQVRLLNHPGQALRMQERIADLGVLRQQGLGRDGSLRAQLLDVAEDVKELPHGKVRDLLHHIPRQLPPRQGRGRCIGGTRSEE
mmetsp:Transcript_15003/g.31309  ORF Transcript_15003/g.31309 Transcript_15003/m.31309 type:complete len:205 (-) Transcript_15003:70-684(-)